MQLGDLDKLIPQALRDEELIKTAEDVISNWEQLKKAEDELLAKIRDGEIKNDVRTFLAVREQMISGEKTAAVSIGTDDIDDVGSLVDSDVSSTGSYDSTRSSLLSKYSRR